MDTVTEEVFLGKAKRKQKHYRKTLKKKLAIEQKNDEIATKRLVKDYRALSCLYHEKVTKEDKDLPDYMKRSIMDQVSKFEVVIDFLKEQTDVDEDFVEKTLRKASQLINQEEENVSETSSRVNEQHKYTETREEQARNRKKACPRNTPKKQNKGRNDQEASHNGFTS